MLGERGHNPLLQLAHDRWCNQNIARSDCDAGLKQRVHTLTN